jgi:hypothetical protein
MRYNEHCIWSSNDPVLSFPASSSSHLTKPMAVTPLYPLKRLRC